jgi:ATP-dependent helicase/nuclease subunit A
LIERSLQGLGEEALHPFLAAQGHEARILRLATPQTAPVQAAAGNGLRRAAPPLPGWARRPAPAEPSPPDRLIPSQPQATPSLAAPFGGKESRARQRGGLIHRLLQILPDLPAAERATVAARMLGRPAWDLSFAEQVEIAGEVARVMADHRFAPLFGPGSRAEVPLIGRLGERVVSGRVDRLLVRQDYVLVVDYKTDRRPPANPPAGYVRQMAAYRGLLACLYGGRPVRCALLWTDQPSWMPLEATLLDDSLAAMAGDA